MLLFSAIFLFLFLLALLSVGFGRAFLVSREKQQIWTMLRRADATGGKHRPDLLKPELLQDPLLSALGQMKLLQVLALVLGQSGSQWNVSKFLSTTMVAGTGGFLVGFIVPPFSRSFLGTLIPAGLAALFPFLIIMRKRLKRMARFEEQFPEALNFLSRSMRAGHAFSIGLEMLVADAPEPLGFTFRLMLNDIHLGASLESAMAKLVESMPLIDVRFFVSAILLQQGSGGNLSEILDSMANIIRERFRLKGQIKAASAHGRITGLILAIMPIIVAGLLFVVSPDYILVLLRDPDGRNLVIGAGAGQVIGFFCIRKIVNIKV
jgi:tight adherence protein B